MAGDGNDGVGEACGRVAAADFFLGDGSVVGADVDAVGSGGDGSLDAGVDKDDGTRGRRGLKYAVGHVGYFGGRKVFFANLDDLDALIGPAYGLLNERGDAFILVTRKNGAIGDGAAEHVDKCRRESSEALIPMCAVTERAAAIW
jgi:hypothetical protein